MKIVTIVKSSLTTTLIVLLASLLTSAAALEYQIGAGDVVRINVYDHPDLATTVRVDNEGSVLFPLAGKTIIGGLSTSQASDVIAKKLDGVYIVNPQVAVFVEEFKSKKVVVLGEVIRPGLYELTGETQVLELISQAGGLSKNAGQTATLRRAEDSGQAQESSINIKELLENGSDLQLMDGDTLTVEKAGVVYVTGEVRRPAAYALDSDTTVIKAITMAGGFTELAAQSKVKIIRKRNGQEHVLEKVSLHEKLISNDVMVVPESFF